MHPSHQTVFVAGSRPLLFGGATSVNHNSRSPTAALSGDDVAFPFVIPPGLPTPAGGNAAAQSGLGTVQVALNDSSQKRSEYSDNNDSDDDSDCRLEVSEASLGEEVTLSQFLRADSPSG